MISINYHYNPEDGGRFTRTTEAHPESFPPDNATRTPPPKTKDYQAACFVNGAWILLPDYTEAEVYSTETGEKIKAELGQSLEAVKGTLLKPEPFQEWNSSKKAWHWPLAFLKEQKLAELADLRWQKQSADIEVKGIVISCAPEDVIRLDAAIADVYLIGSETITFKAVSGFVDVTPALLEEARQAIAAKTQACFDVERTHTEVIETITTEAKLNKYNITAGWPV